jgi:hypothetical protein
MEAVKCRGELILYSRRKNSLNHRFDYVASALKGLPDETAIDGVGARPGGKPPSICFRTSVQPSRHIIHIYYAFVILFRHRRPL